jgi:hypothetical protein
MLEIVEIELNRALLPSSPNVIENIEVVVRFFAQHDQGLTRLAPPWRSTALERTAGSLTWRAVELLAFTLLMEQAGGDLT